ncbi:MAG: hypothetical protein FRX49_09123 [Trebouxia sp. A1-2]|nr:MAG: hypothetical protein FRX49_09123 [Trebouxia sp. A1-2]
MEEWIDKYAKQKVSSSSQNMPTRAPMIASPAPGSSNTPRPSPPLRLELPAANPLVPFAHGRPENLDFAAQDAVIELDASHSGIGCCARSRAAFPLKGLPTELKPFF